MPCGHENSSRDVSRAHTLIITGTNELVIIEKKISEKDKEERSVERE